ncbi:MAG TPA: cysteine desulfurase family protein [Drouetiella sp.]
MSYFENATPNQPSRIYLDNSATTPLRPEVIQAIEPYLATLYGNPSSVHHFGRQSKAAVEIARQKLANLLGAKPNEIYFTPSATYSNNVALLGRARYVEQHNLGKHLITSAIEHASILGPVKFLESQGWKVTVLDADAEGFVDEQKLINAITSETSIISIMWANNEIGTVQSIERFAQIAKPRNIYFHTDAVQVVGKLRIDVSKTPVDTLSLSGHKFHAPKGIGALYVRDGVQINPIMFGGGQEHGLFLGTEALTAIIAIGAAAEAANSKLDEMQVHLQKAQSIFADKFKLIPNVVFTGAADLTKRVPGHLSVIVKGSLGEELVEKADAFGISVSSVSACSTNHPSHVLSNLGYSPDDVIASVRISASTLNSLRDCEFAAEVLANIFAGGTGVNAPTKKVEQSNVIDFSLAANLMRTISLSL